MNNTMEEGLQCLEATRTLVLNIIRRRLHALSPFSSKTVCAVAAGRKGAGERW